MEDYLLPQVKQNIVLAIDEADRLLQRPYHDTFFGLLRFWHNNRAMNELWENLDLVMVISTEPHLLISDVTQSPFNVGLKIRLEDFDETQVRELNRRHHYPLEEGQIASLVEFLDGHPYLTRKALYTLLTEGISWEKLAQIAATEASPFGDHLRRYLWLLRDQPELRKALKLILAKGNCQDETTFYRLYRAGLIKGTGCQACRMRCKLYEIYLADKLS
jgi:hypothetical protein